MPTLISIVRRIHFQIINLWIAIAIRIIDLIHMIRRQLVNRTQFRHMSRTLLQDSISEHVEHVEIERDVVYDQATTYQCELGVQMLQYKEMQGVCHRVQEIGNESKDKVRQQLLLEELSDCYKSLLFFLKFA